ncbi:MAG: HepT-like ribonuclease domain-containing protein [Jaaginema sp. PMC 1079.18]|nr:HepT-like ribonuclease domain-containing protein [Jaaginema sp. PMC 1080.18]MEC4854089.1 HepT-like ribonuclease domain-containing protein [Jaaginema sp. PMC 1079.18]MEC4868194.1 HepT-like ribonuclease domain-containing protein [Jaaginema sp. PMC 1078.18]
MSSREFELRVRDILLEIAVIEETIAELSYEEFAQNRQVLRVVLYCLAVIGEAVSTTVSELEAAESRIPWYQIRGMRNIVIHEYFRVDIQMIWETVQRDLQPLKAALQQILTNLADDS